MTATLTFQTEPSRPASTFAGAQTGGWPTWGELPELSQLPVLPPRTSPRETLERALSRFAPTALSQLSEVTLLDRTDTKFLLTTSQLGAALGALTGDYWILEIDGARLHHYQTLYFDTPDFALFRRHHTGKAVRHKVRSRAYLDSGLSYLEVKAKNNKGRTLKHRLATRALVDTLRAEEGAFVSAHAPVRADALEPKLWNEFHRITLVGIRHAERLTIDVGLSFETGSHHTAELPGIVVAELKQHGVDRSSPFARQMRAAHVQPASMSKYCVGVSLLHQDVPHNAFKPTLRTIHKLMKEETHVW
jgi:hypothetical protein